MLDQIDRWHARPCRNRMQCRQFRRLNGLNFGCFWANGIIFHQPRFHWNKRVSLTKPPFGVRSCEIAIIWPDVSSIFFYNVIHCLKTNSQFRPWKWMVGIRSFPVWDSAYFQGWFVSFREGNGLWVKVFSFPQSAAELPEPMWRKNTSNKSPRIMWHYSSVKLQKLKFLKDVILTRDDGIRGKETTSSKIDSAWIDLMILFQGAKTKT